jgi:ferredoxin-thioredoxin reductase catalytic subunit
MGERRCVCRVLVGKSERKRPLVRPRHRWEDNIEMDHQEVGCGVVDWIGLAQDRDGWKAVVNAVMNLRVP